MTKKPEKELPDYEVVTSILSNAVNRVALKRLVTGSIVAKSPEEFEELIADEAKSTEELDKLLCKYLAKKTMEEKMNQACAPDPEIEKKDKYSIFFNSLLRKRNKSMRAEKEDQIAKLFKSAFIKTQK